jgi:outer membrane protein assembly factor BamA
MPSFRVAGSIVASSLIAGFVFCVPVTALGSQADSTAADTSKSRTALSAYPYVYYTPETELAFGAGGIVTFYTADDQIIKPSKVVLSGYYSTKKQYSVTLNPSLYFLSNRYYASAKFDFGYFVDKFWGVGPGSVDNDSVGFASRSSRAELDLQFPPLFGFSTRVGLLYNFRYYSVVDKKINPHLQDPSITGIDGGITSGLGLTWVWDSRDYTFFPGSGGFHQVKILGWGEALGSDFGFYTYELDVRRYVTLAHEQIIAFQIYGKSTTGEPPFYELPALGGSSRMRGYYEGRFRDKHYVMSQIEYRTILWNRLGAVAFFGVGDVANEWRGYTLGDFKKSWGGGLRYIFNAAEHVNLRCDFGFGEGTNGVVFGLEEAF